MHDYEVRLLRLDGTPVWEGRGRIVAADGDSLTVELPRQATPLGYFERQFLRSTRLAGVDLGPVAITPDPAGPIEGAVVIERRRWRWRRTRDRFVPSWERMGPDDQAVADVEVSTWWQWSKFLLGWQFDSHPSEASVQVHAGPWAITLWWYRARPGEFP